MSSYLKMQASEDFSRARGKAFLSRIQNFISPERDELLSFEDVKEILHPKNETYRGMQVVQLDQIVGSEGRYRDFNKFFLPRADHLRARWMQVDMAHLEDRILPPIQLYEIGGVYFVRDGNHRVSVARSQGASAIDAEVTSLSSEITITPDMTTDQLRQALVAYEKESFYSFSGFLAATGDGNLNFSTAGRYDVIYNHILVHKYFLNERSVAEIPLGEAIQSWYGSVYRPIADIIVEHRIVERFPGRTVGDLYVWIVQHWDFLKKKYGVQYPVSDAVSDFSRRYGKDPSLSLIERLIRLWKRIFGRER